MYLTCHYQIRFIGENDISDEGVKEIVKALQKKNTLMKLNLGIFQVLLLFIEENSIDYKGAKEIGFALQKSYSLIELNLSTSSIQHYCYYLQEEIILATKEQRKLDQLCIRTIH
eukprot:TRINITY_DN535_c1_g1_i1.p4 TRINITY_DN535_c1_g1~~TRINITY_DN535_c1_g1_i1.p4  ORF type:complete len:114 (-),score=10.08 TRINITY_DN535_c1_g1_i1:189-530(-)